MTLTLSAISPPDPAAQVTALARPVYFVMRQAAQPWSQAAEIVTVVHNQITAEAIAAKAKERAPAFHYGVMKLICEARAVLNPIEIVNMEKS